MSMNIRKENQALYQLAIELHQQYGYGSRKLSHIIPVNDRTIRRWLTNFAQESKSQKISKMNAKPIPASQSNEPISELEARIAKLEALNSRLQAQNAQLESRNNALEHKLKFEQVKAIAFEHLIELAERNGLPVRKNSGTKQ